MSQEPTPAKCKKCGIVWKDRDEIGDATKAEHKKHLGHFPELT